MKKKKPKPTSTAGRIWYFVWHEDSVWSWIVNIILAFIIIKYLVYPGLGLLFGTAFPIVAVVSESMEHPGGFDEWWQSPASCPGRECTQQEWYLNREINQNDFQEFPFKNGFNKGDIIVLLGNDPSKVEVGDVIVFQSGKEYPIIHRAIAIESNNRISFQTKGDHNQDQINRDGLNEFYVSETQLLGKAAVRVPWLGYVKIWAVDLLRYVGVYQLLSPGS